MSQQYFGQDDLFEDPGGDISLANGSDNLSSDPGEFGMPGGPSGAVLETPGGKLDGPGGNI